MRPAEDKIHTHRIPACGGAAKPIHRCPRRREVVVEAQLTGRDHAKVGEADAIDVVLVQPRLEGQQVLAPIDVGIGQVPPTSPRAARPLIEVRQVSGVMPQAQRQGQQAQPPDPPDRCPVMSPEPGDGEPGGQVQQREGGQDIAKAQLHAQGAGRAPDRGAGDNQHDRREPVASPGAPGHDHQSGQHQHLGRMGPLVRGTPEVVEGKAFQVPLAIEVDRV